MSATLLVGVDCARTRELAAAVPADLVATPQLDDPTDWKWTFAGQIEHFKEQLLDGPRVDRAVVCTWAPEYQPRSLVDTGADEWLIDVERSLALWTVVLDAVAQRCEDGGAMAVVVERPAPLDSTGHVATTAVAEGVAVLARSLALVHGERGTRINTVTSAVGSAPEVLLGLPPALPTYPGTPAREVAGAVRMVLGPDACGVTGTVVHADAGRS